MLTVEPRDSYRIDAESDEYVDILVVAVKPTWRDVWAILRGRYRPKVVRRERLTPAGLLRALKQAWTGSRVGEALYGDNRLRAMLADSLDNPLQIDADAITPIKGKPKDEPPC